LPFKDLGTLDSTGYQVTSRWSHGIAMRMILSRSPTWSCHSERKKHIEPSALSLSPEERVDRAGANAVMVEGAGARNVVKDTAENVVEGSTMCDATWWHGNLARAKRHDSVLVPSQCVRVATSSGWEDAQA